MGWGWGGVGSGWGGLGGFGVGVGGFGVGGRGWGWVGSNGVELVLGVRLRLNLILGLGPRLMLEARRLYNHTCASV